MRQLYNERHMEMEEKATDLDILREANKRSVDVSEHFSKELEHLEAKERGFNVVFNLIEKYAKEHWFYMTDLALDYYGTITCDLLLVTSAGVYPFDINYYDGIFEVENSQSTLNDQHLEHNPIINTQQVASQLKSISMMNSVHLNVHGAAIFPSPDNSVIINDDTKGIEVVTSDQLENYLKKIVQAEKNYDGPPMNTPRHLRWFGHLDRHFPIWTVEIPDNMDHLIKKGIMCCHCESFDITIDHPYISCDCGMHESLEEATVRTICEYGVLNNDKELEVSELLNFFDYQISEDTLYEYLDKHFTPVF